MKKPVFYTEIAYFLGLFLLAFGTALTTYGGFGISMVVAPAYILHLYLSQFFPFFTFGVAEYTLQAVMFLVMLLLLRKVRLSYFLSFLAAVLYGFALDCSLAIIALFPQSLPLQLAMYVLGIIICTGSISLLFSTYLPPEVYEIIVKELAAKLKKPASTVKTVYDFSSLMISVVLSLLFFGTLRGIGIGTVVCAFIYGILIRLFTRLYNKLFVFQDRFPLRNYFEESENRL